MIDITAEDKFHDECGVMGVYSSDKDLNVAPLVFYGLFALQHRGQESAGIAVTNKEGQTNFHKGMGYVSEVFKDDNGYQLLDGHMGIGHVRYSTTGDSNPVNAQPLVVKHKNHVFALGHNGNLVNADSIRNMLEDDGVVFQTSIDTEVIANLIARNFKHGVVKAVKMVMELLKGAYALTILADNTLIGVRDPFGLRPLCFGKLPDGGYAIASESCALDTIGAEFIRDVEPGEIIIVNEDGLHSIKGSNYVSRKSCIFELIYFARPDSIVDGVTAHSYRYKCGKILAEETFVEADRVIAVPDSGIPASIGFSEESGISLGVGLIKNRYAGRTFIQPDQRLRELGVQLKLNVLKKNVTGKRVIMVDDSLVRGTTSKRIVQLLRDAGAKEVHLRIASPPVTHPCHFGIDTPSRDELVGSKMSIDEICKLVGADTLGYISVEGAQRAANATGGFCRACFDGQYPMEVPKEGNKFKFEAEQIRIAGM